MELLVLKRKKNLFLEIINYFLAWKILFVRRIAKYFVFEFRSQRYGRIEFAAKSLKPKVGVFMWVAPAHAEYFGSLDEIYKEKSKLIVSLPKDGVAVLNYDDKRVRQAAELSKAKVIFFGLSPEADIWASNVGAGLSGLKARLHYKGKEYSLSAPNIFNQNHIHPLLASMAVLLSLDFPISEIISAVKELKPMSQRSNIEEGINGSHLINETFNANPKSVIGSLEMLKSVAGDKRKVAVLGDMLEQGEYRISGHRQVGESAAKIVDELFLIGENSKITAESAKKRGLSDQKVHWFSDIGSLTTALKSNIKKDDFILFKGSRAMKIDQVLEKLKVEEEKCQRV